MMGCRLVGPVTLPHGSRSGPQGFGPVGTSSMNPPVLGSWSSSPAHLQLCLLDELAAVLSPFMPGIVNEFLQNWKFACG